MKAEATIPPANAAAMLPVAVNNESSLYDQILGTISTPMLAESSDTANVIEVGTFALPPLPVLDSTTYIVPKRSPTTVPPVWLFLTYDPGPVPPA